MTGTSLEFDYLLDGQGSAQRVEPGEPAAGAPKGSVRWVMRDFTGAETRRWLLRDDGVPHVIADALLASDARPRSVITDQGILVVLRGVNTNPGSEPEDMVSIRVWLEPRRIITTVRRNLLSVEDVAAALTEGSGPRDPGEFLAHLVERLADRIGIVVEDIEAQIQAAEDTIEDSASNDIGATLGVLRRQIATIRRHLAPQRDALDRLFRQPVDVLADGDIAELREQSDRTTRYLEDLDLAREQAVVLREELTSRLAQEQNSRMYVLSVAAAIFLPLSFVTGLWGMNIGGLPGADNPLGFVEFLALMLVLVIALIWFFKRKKWL